MRDELTEYELELNQKVYMNSRKYAEEKGIQIYNATRGGKLEIFNRVNLDELFEN